MAITKTGFAVSIVLALLFAAVNALVLLPSPGVSLVFAVRLFALNGYLALAIAAVMSAFPAQVGRVFGRPFLGVHHLFAAGGIVLVTLHPVVLALFLSNPLVFLPSGSQALNAGRAALVLGYVALAASLLRRRVMQWRYFHALVYLVLALAYFHGSAVGTDFATPVIRAAYTLLFAAVVLTLLAGVLRKAVKARARKNQPPSP